MNVGKETNAECGELLKEAEAAAKLGLSVRTLQQWRSHRKPPPYIKLSRAVRYAAADLDEFVAAGRRPAAPLAVASIEARPKNQQSKTVAHGAKRRQR